MKKIALLHFAYPPFVGGVEVVISQQARVLADLGFSVTVLVGAGVESDSRIELIQIPEFQSLIQLQPEMQEAIMKGVFDDSYQKLVEKIGRQLESYGKDQDVFIVHNMITLYRNIAFVEAFTAYVAKHPEKKFIVWVHDHIFLVDGEILQQEVSDKIQTLLTKPISGVTYVVISQTFADRLKTILPVSAENIRVIPNGVSVKEVLELDEILWQFVQSHDLLSAFPLLLAPVNILPRKNLGYTIEVFAALKKTYPTARLLISGAPSQHRNTHGYLTDIEDLIASHSLEKDVLFLKDFLKDNQSEKIIHDLYVLCDIVLYFSKSENFGLPLLESALFKTPLFVSNLTVFHEIGGDYLSYINTEEMDSSEAAVLIEKYLRENQIILFRKEVKTKFALEEILQKKLVPLL